MRNDTMSRRSRQQGYNLVEVLVAMGLLSTVLISIVTLFVMGRANVYSGKQMTRAVSVATSVSEDLSPLNVARTLEAFSIDAADDVTATVTVGGIDYSDAIVISTDDLSVDAKGYLDRWDDMIPQQRLTDGRVSLVFQPRDLKDAADVTTANVLQIAVVVEWNEAARERHVELKTVKLNRKA
jgi:type II secretory pathway pseudopilin PulG